MNTHPALTTRNGVNPLFNLNIRLSSSAPIPVDDAMAQNTNPENGAVNFPSEILRDQICPYISFSAHRESQQTDCGCHRSGRRGAHGEHDQANTG